MAKELVLDVVAKKNSKDLLLLAQEFETLSKEIDGANKSARQNVTFSKFLDDQIAETRKQVQQLTQEFQKTGDADIFGRLRGSQRNLDTLARIRRQLGDVGDEEKKAADTTQELTRELSDSEKALRGLSNEYNNLGADVRRVKQDYDDLTDRIKVQTDTVRTLRRESRQDDSVSLYARQASNALDHLREQAIDLREVLDAAPVDASTKFRSFDEYVTTRIIGQRNLVKSLEQDLAHTGNRSVFGDLDKAKKDLRVLEDLGKDLGLALESGVQDGTRKGLQVFGEAFSSLPPQAQAGIAAGVVGAIAGASSFIGAAIDGVLLAGVGLGGVAAGIVGQIKSPQVASAFGDLKTTGLNVLSESTRSFAPLLVAGAHEFESELLKAEPVLERAFDKLAPHAEAIFHGLERFAEEAGPGILKALQASGPILDELGHDFATLGKVTSDFFSSVADGSTGAKEGLHDLFLLIDATVEGLGLGLKALSLDFQILNMQAALFKGDIYGYLGFTTNAKDTSERAGRAAAHLAESLGGVNNSAKDAAAAIDKLNQKYDQMIGKNLSADQAAVREKQSIADLTASLQENGNAWDINTEKGRANQQALLNAIQAAEQKRQADVANGRDAIKAAQDYNQEVQSLLAIAAKAGDSKAALQALAGEYIINVDEYYKTHFITEGTPPPDFHHGLAGGGDVRAGQTYLVGEKGPELFMSSVPGQIIPNDALKSLGSPPPAFRASSAVGGSGGATVTFAGDTTSAFATAFMQLVRTGVIQIN